MDINDFNDRIKNDLFRYQNVLGEENWSMTHMSFTNEKVPNDSLVVLAGRPRTGKTTLLLDFIARNSLQPRKENEVFLNDIMSRKGLVYFIGHKEEIVLRNWFTIVNQSEISRKMSDYHLDEVHEKYLSSIKDAIINFNFYNESEQVASVIEEDINNFNPDYIVIDSIIDKFNLAASENRKHELKDELLTTSINLQKKTKKFFLLSISLGHDAWYRYGDKRHPLEDLHSIELESNADVVFMLHRPEIYGVSCDEEGNSMENLTEVFSVLNRYGKEQIKYNWIFEKGIPSFLSGEN